MPPQVAKEKVEAMRAERDAYAERLRHVEAVTLQQDTSAVEELQVSAGSFTSSTSTSTERKHCQRHRQLCQVGQPRDNSHAGHICPTG
jgi:hypothetical protein